MADVRLGIDARPADQGAQRWSAAMERVSRDTERAVRLVRELEKASRVAATAQQRGPASAPARDTGQAQRAQEAARAERERARVAQEASRRVAEATRRETQLRREQVQLERQQAREERQLNQERQRIARQLVQAEQEKARAQQQAQARLRQGAVAQRSLNQAQTQAISAFRRSQEAQRLETDARRRAAETARQQQQALQILQRAMSGQLTSTTEVARAFNRLSSVQQRAVRETLSFRSTLGGSERAASQLVRAQIRLGTAVDREAISARESARLHRMMAQSFNTAAVKGRDLRSNMQRLQRSTAVLAFGPLSGVGARLNTVSALAQEGGASFAALGLAVAGVTALFAGLLAGIRSSIRSVDQAAKSARALGLSFEELQTLRFVGLTQGIENIDRAMGAFVRRINDLRQGGGQAIDALRQLGVNLTDIQEATPFEAIRLLVDAVDEAEAKMIASGAAADLFSRSQQQLALVLGLSLEEFDALVQQARDVGAVLAEDVAVNAEEAENAIGVLSQVFKTQLQGALISAAPALTEFAKSLTQFVGQVGPALEFVFQVPASESAFETRLQERREAIEREITLLRDTLGTSEGRVRNFLGEQLNELGDVPGLRIFASGSESAEERLRALQAELVAIADRENDLAKMRDTFKSLGDTLEGLALDPLRELRQEIDALTEQRAALESGGLRALERVEARQEAEKILREALEQATIADIAREIEGVSADATREQVLQVIAAMVLQRERLEDALKETEKVAEGVQKAGDKILRDIQEGSRELVDRQRQLRALEEVDILPSGIFDRRALQQLEVEAAAREARLKAIQELQKKGLDLTASEEVLREQVKKLQKEGLELTLDEARARVDVAEATARQNAETDQSIERRKAELALAEALADAEFERETLTRRLAVATGTTDREQRRVERDIAAEEARRQRLRELQQAGVDVTRDAIQADLDRVESLARTNERMRQQIQLIDQQRKEIATFADDAADALSGIFGDEYRDAIESATEFLLSAFVSAFDEIQGTSDNFLRGLLEGGQLSAQGLGEKVGEAIGKGIQSGDLLGSLQTQLGAIFGGPQAGGGLPGDIGIQPAPPPTTQLPPGTVFEQAGASAAGAGTQAAGSAAGAGALGAAAAGLGPFGIAFAAVPILRAIGGAVADFRGNKELGSNFAQSVLNAIAFPGRNLPQPFGFSGGSLLADLIQGVFGDVERARFQLDIGTEEQPPRLDFKIPSEVSELGLIGVADKKKVDVSGGVQPLLKTIATFLDGVAQTLPDTLEGAIERSLQERNFRAFTSSGGFANEFLGVFQQVADTVVAPLVSQLVRDTPLQAQFEAGIGPFINKLVPGVFGTTVPGADGPRKGVELLGERVLSFTTIVGEAAPLMEQGALGLQDLLDAVRRAADSGELKELAQEFISFNDTMEGLRRERLPEVEQALLRVGDEFDKLADQANRLGVSASFVEAERQQARREVATGFTDQITQDFLSALDPLAGEINAQLATNAERLANARVLLSEGLIAADDFFRVLQLNALETQSLIDETETATRGFVVQLQDLTGELTDSGRELRDLGLEMVDARDQAEALGVSLDRVSGSFAAAAESVVDEFGRNLVLQAAQATSPEAAGFLDNRLRRREQNRELRALLRQGAIGPESATIVREAIRDLNIATQRQLFEQIADPIREAFAGLEDFRRELAVSDALAPTVRIDAARAQFEAQAALAQTGDVEAVQGLPQVGQQLLQIARQTFASGPEFFAIRQLVESTLAQVETAEQPTIEQAIRDAQEQANAIFQDLRTIERETAITQTNVAQILGSFTDPITTVAQEAAVQSALLGDLKGLVNLQTFGLTNVAGRLEAIDAFDFANLPENLREFAREAAKQNVLRDAAATIPGLGGESLEPLIGVTSEGNARLLGLGNLIGEGNVELVSFRQQAHSDAQENTEELRALRAEVESLRREIRAQES